MGKLGTCDSCGKRFSAPDHVDFAKARCPACRGTIIALMEPTEAPAEVSTTSDAAAAPVRVRTGMVIGLLIASCAAWVLLRMVEVAVWPFRSGPGETDTEGYVVLMLLELLASCGIAVMVLFILHRMWAAVADDASPIRPAAAWGFMFVPFFNLYWYGRVWWAWPDAYQQYMRRHGVEGHAPLRGLFVSFVAANTASVLQVLLSGAFQIGTSYSGGNTRVSLPASLDQMISLTLLVLTVTEVCRCINSMATREQKRGRSGSVSTLENIVGRASSHA